NRCNLKRAIEASVVRYAVGHTGNEDGRRSERRNAGVDAVRIDGSDLNGVSGSSELRYLDWGVRRRGKIDTFQDAGTPRWHIRNVTQRLKSDLGAGASAQRYESDDANIGSRRRSTRAQRQAGRCRVRI